MPSSHSLISLRGNGSLLHLCVLPVALLLMANQVYSNARDPRALTGQPATFAQTPQRFATLESGRGRCWLPPETGVALSTDTPCGAQREWQPSPSGHPSADVRASFSVSAAEAMALCTSTVHLRSGARNCHPGSCQPSLFPLCQHTMARVYLINNFSDDHLQYTLPECHCHRPIRLFSP